MVVTSYNWANKKLTLRVSSSRIKRSKPSDRILAKIILQDVYPLLQILLPFQHHQILTTCHPRQSSGFQWLLPPRTPAILFFAPDWGCKNKTLQGSLHVKILQHTLPNKMMGTIWRCQTSKPSRDWGGILRLFSSYWVRSFGLDLLGKGGWKRYKYSTNGGF